MTSAEEYKEEWTKEKEKNVSWIFLMKYLILALVVMLLSQFVWYELVQPEVCPLNTYTSVRGEDKERRDHLANAQVVVIGGGPAGSVVAHKAASVGLKTVLIEAGDGSQRVLGGKDWLFRDRTVFDVPLAWSYVSQLPEFLWQVAAGDIARALGGSGVHNAMLYVRALPGDLERWNASTWTYDTLLKQYLALEDFQENVPESNDDTKEIFHANGGPVAVSRNIVQDLLAQKFLETVKIAEDAEVSMPILNDFNAPHRPRIGAGPYHFNIRDGVRESAAAVFLGGTISGYDPIPNLQIWSGLTVTKLILNEQRKITALHLSKNSNALFIPNKVRSIHMNLHPDVSIILTAGAVLTPHLLLASGIGPSDAIPKNKEHIVNAPHVGKNLQDHPVVAIEFAVQRALTADIADMFARFNHWTKLGVSLNSYSSAFSYPGFSLGAFIHSGIDPYPEPDLQLTLFPIQIEPHLAPDGKNSSASVHYDKALVTVALIRPETTYDVRIGPDGRPRFYSPIGLYNELNHRKPRLVQRDVDRLAIGVRRVRKIFAEKPLSDFIIQETRPGIAVQTHEQLAQW
eukprot:CAMPEP_0197320114 /NCGR_PEP_ID=MMETSP0891-20130614/57730_1 /TAXON_ID=44058 ORGANISM="Aureoumbra lagunensis, Strain CCMP1510" /NCGR_SAMPLE_ID=MMETSP0891 /ASSEMBLY_ACC=CAM_ASM_000534 /LENGTH=570 /DNA_ID=CAMNT_0042811345 /DNA_START=11 /DNA_END=1720 /DNA_ORIENTATION=-